jgi:hypothetical protein
MPATVAKHDLGEKAQPWIGWPMVWALVVLTVALTFPVTPAPYYMDDWDFVHDIASLPFVGFLLRPSYAGQFIPFFKLIYGTFLLLFRYDNLPLLQLQFLVRGLTFWIWTQILRRAGIWSPSSALLLLAIGVSQVGVFEIFHWDCSFPWELGLFFFSLALLYAPIPGKASRPNTGLGSGLALSLGALSYGSGLAFCVSFILAYGVVLILSQRRPSRFQYSPLLPTAAGLAFTMLAFLICKAGHSQGASASFPNVPQVLRFFFYQNLVYPGLAGLHLGVLSGRVSVLLTATLLAGAVLLTFRSAQPYMRLVVCNLLIASWGLNLLISLTRWQEGYSYAASYRYLYGNVVFHCLLIACLVGTVAKRIPERRSAFGPWVRPLALGLAVIIAVFSLTGGLRGKRELRTLEARRAQLIVAVCSGRAPATRAADLHETGDLEKIRACLAISQGRATGQAPH